MKLIRSEYLSTEETLRRFSQTRLSGHGEALIYQKAKLELFYLADPNQLFPAQRYVLQRDLDTIFTLEEQFAAIGVDIYALTCAVLFWLEHDDGTVEGPIPLCPPIVELTREPAFTSAGINCGRPYEVISLINDGMHRVSAARARGRHINAILVSGDIPYPYYAKPLPNGWSDVHVFDELPDNFVKKEYRDPENYRALFRDFNAVFPGIQKQRKRAEIELATTNT